MTSSCDEVFKKPYDIYRENSARRRWKILARAVMKILRNGSCDDVSNLGQLFINYELFTVLKINDEQFDDPDGEWFEYSTTSSGDISYSFMIRRPRQKLTLHDLAGIDNSGNICIWPSEQALAYYLLQNKHVFVDKSILELGGGMTCLAGLTIAKFSSPSKVELTDGNRNAVDNVCEILKRNGLQNVVCSVFKWGVNNSRFRDVRSKFDIIIAADCLYSKKNRSKLLRTIRDALKDQGIALIFAPQRGNIVDKFETEANLKGFLITKEIKYNDNIWEKHLFLTKYNKYNGDKHYPLLLLLTKRRENEVSN